MGDCPIGDKLTKYCDYLTEHYISEDSTFPPKLWACNSSSLRLTTNTCESFHSHFNKNFNTKSPSIMPWLNIILQVQVDIYVKINSAQVLKILKEYKRQEINEFKIIQYKSGRLT